MEHTNNKSSIPKPFIKWAGGKSGLLAQLQLYFPTNFNSYFEPFIGGGAVFFSLDKSYKFCINDINTKLMQAYSDIKNTPEVLIEELCKVEDEYNQLRIGGQKEFFYAKRDEFNSINGGVQKTVLLIFLNKACFNGLYRENKKGSFNVPFGQRRKISLCNPENIYAVSVKLQNTKILNTNFSFAVNRARKDDFIYFDPPYHPLNTSSSFTSYNKDDFCIAEQKKLANLYRKLDKRGCKIMLSNSDTELIHELYDGFRIETVHAGRAINSKGSKRGKITELLVLNY